LWLCRIPPPLSLHQSSTSHPWLCAVCCRTLHEVWASATFSNKYKDAWHGHTQACAKEPLVQAVTLEACSRLKKYVPAMSLWVQNDRSAFMYLDLLVHISLDRRSFRVSLVQNWLQEHVVTENTQGAKLMSTAAWINSTHTQVWSALSLSSLDEEAVRAFFFGRSLLYRLNT
jgi:hypothetical protein